MTDPAGQFKDSRWRRWMRRRCFSVYRYADNLSRMPARTLAWRIYNRVLCPPVRKAAMKIRPRRTPSRALVRRASGRDSLEDLARAWLGAAEGFRYLWPDPPAAAASARMLDPHGVADTLKRADNLLAGRFELLEGKPSVECRIPFQWQADPLGDIEWPHALNRFRRYARCLARAYLYTGDEKYASFVLDVMDDWVDANPCGTPVAWASMATSLRLLEWTWVLDMLRASGSLTAPRLARLWGSMTLQASFLARHPEIELSDNHLIYNFGSLVHLGGALPFLLPDKTRAWAMKGFLRELRRQHRADGMNAEQSTHYFVQVARIYIEVYRLVASEGTPSPDLEAHVRKFVDDMAGMVRPGGTIPLYSDAFTSFFEPSASDDVRALLAWAAVEFRRGDLKRIAGSPTESACWMLGDRCAEFEAVEATEPRANVTVLPDSGYAFFRSDWTDDACYCSADFGPLGFPPVPAHGHPDLLSFEWFHNGRAVVVDPGTYEYEPGEWAYYFRRTRAHATVTVDGADQATQWGFTRWVDLPAVRVGGVLAGRDHLCVEAAHDGYARLDSPVYHRRRLLYFHPGLVVVDDLLTGSGQHLLEQTFPLAPRLGCTAGADRPEAAVLSNGTTIARIACIHAPPGTAADVAVGKESPCIWGFSAPNYGVLDPAPVAVFRANAAVPARFVTVLSAGDKPVPRGENGRCLCAPGEGVEYAIAVGDDGLLVTQVRDGLVRAAIAVGLRSADLDGETVACPPCWCDFRRDEGRWRLESTSREAPANA
jgi:uncharacterized heparinase superfamily protein